jgi:hypothetical protein
MVVLFPLGRVVATPGALDVLDPEETLTLLSRHVSGDWGDIGPEDWKMNDRDLREGERLFSVYELDGARGSRRVYVITEWDRSVTTILLPEEY